MEKRRSWLPALWTFIAFTGGLLILVGIVAIAGSFFLPNLVQDQSLGVITAGVGLIAIIFGGGLVWAGLSGRSGVPSPLFYSRFGWLILGTLTLLTIGIGVFIPVRFQLNPLFAPLHLIVMSFPALALLLMIALLVGRHAAPTFREAVLTLTGGASSILLALPLEIVALVIVLIVVAVIALIFPGGEAELMRLTGLVENWQEMEPTMDEALSLLASPIVLLGLTLLLAVATPLIEEFTKGIVVGLLGFWKRPGLLSSFAWGAACGLGFAIVEGVTNGSMSLGDTAGWVGSIGARALATTMHAFASGVVGLGWGLFWHKRWWWALPLSYLCAVLFHGLWNFNVILLLGGAAEGVSGSGIGFAVLFVGIVLGLITVVTALVGVFAVPLLIRRYEKPEPVQQESAAPEPVTPLEFSPLDVAPKEAPPVAEPSQVDAPIPDPFTEMEEDSPQAGEDDERDESEGL